MKKLIMLIALSIFLTRAFPSHAEIYQYFISNDTADFTQMYWNWNGNGNDMVVQTGTYWEGSLLVEPISNGFNVTYGFSNAAGAIFSSGPITFTSFESASGYFEFDGIRYGHEIDIHVHSTDWAHADTFVWTEGPVVVPEPISSTLFIVGGATLGLRRFRKLFRK